MRALDQVLDRLLPALRAGQVTAADQPEWAVLIEQATVDDAQTGPLAERDRLLCEVRAKFFPNHSRGEAARAIADVLRSFERRAWIRHRGREHCPAEYANRLEGFIFAVFKFAPRSLTDRHLERIFRHFECRKVDAIVSSTN